jgi:hypothetical protein
LQSTSLSEQAIPDQNLNGGCTISAFTYRNGPYDLKKRWRTTGSQKNFLATSRANASVAEIASIIIVNYLMKKTLEF